MQLATQISDILKKIQQRNEFTDQELAEHVGVSRWTIWRIQKGEIGRTVSTSLVEIILKERQQPIDRSA